MHTTATDPITTEIIRNAFNAAADDMNAALIRSAFNPVIYEMKDCSVAVLDAEHQVLGQSAGLPIFLGNLEICSRVTEAMYGVEAWCPGDIWLMNDSYLTGAHLNDVTVFGPIFFADQLAGFAACRAHWRDVGSKDPAGSMDATDIFQEGIRIGPLKVVDRHVERPDVVDLLRRNSRLAHAAVGDLGAQIACIRTGQRLMTAVLERYGEDTVLAARDEIFAQTERMERAAVAEIPDGVYRAEGCLDNDGMSDEPVWVRVAVEVSGHQISMDLTESDDARQGPVNCGEAQAISACRVAYKTLVSPDGPSNGGAFRPLDVQVRRGSLLGAELPAPCQWYFTPLGLLIDLVVKALAPVMPTQVAAASYGDAMITRFVGRDARRGDERDFIDQQPTIGGWGGWDGADGESALISSVNGWLKDLPIEVYETKYPMRVARYGFREDSGGSGRWRGGNGVVREYVVGCTEVDLSLWFERSLTPAWGLFGAGDATPPCVIVNPGSEDERRLLKCSRLRLKRGDVVRALTGGGGGFGDPRERSHELVDADLRNRHVSIEAARATYGFEPPATTPSDKGLDR